MKRPGIGEPPVRTLRDGRGTQAMLQRCAFAIVMVAATAMLRAALTPWIGDGLPLVFFVIPVMIAAWWGGMRCGLLATAASLLIGWLYFVQPRFQLLFKGDADVAVRFALFTVVAVVLSMLGSRARRSVREARHSEGRFRSTFENAAVGMALVGVDGKARDVNQRLCEIAGRSQEELCRLPLTESVYPEDVEPARQRTWALLHGEIDGYSMELRYRRQDESVVWINLTTSLQRDEVGRPEYFIAVIEDITVRKLAEESLRVNFKQLQDTFEGMVEPALLADADANVIAVNSAYLALFDLQSAVRTREELMEQLEFQTTEGEPIRSEQSPFYRALQGEVVRGMEVKGRNRHTGKVFHILSGSAPVRDADGKIAAVILTSIDITERMRAEQALHRSNQVLRQFAYAAAHDLQEPLRNVAIASELLARMYSGKWDQEADRLLATNVEGARRMHRMVKDLLEYARIVDQAVREELPLIESDESLQIALQNLDGSIRETGAKVTSDALPALAVRGTHLVQLFQNLISNSLKYRKENVTPCVHVAAVKEGAEWIISVRDNGMGFDPVHAERIFGLFKRLHTRDEYAGTGIGLAICTRIVEHYGGRIWADAVLGKGATFSFALPVTEGGSARAS